MKYLLLFSLLFLNTFILSAQIDSKINKQLIYVSLGKPIFTTGYSSKTDYCVSLNYQNRFSKSFALEGFYTFANSNNFPSFFDNPVELDTYLRSQIDFDIFSNSLWAKISVHSIGAKIHYAFINNDKWFFSFNLSGGVFFSKSSDHLLESWGTDSEGRILRYTNSIRKGNISGLFYEPSLQLQRTFRQQYLIGLKLGAHLIRETDNMTVENAPVLPIYYNLSLLLGKHF